MPRVLIIDDSPLVLNALRDTLETRGFVVQTESMPARALELLAEEAPDVVISDYDMPELSGLDVVRWVKKLRPDLPVLILTAHGDVPQAVGAMRAGAFSWLAKNFDDDALIVELNAAVRHHELVLTNRRLAAENKRHVEELELRLAEKAQAIAEMQKAQAYAEKLAGLGTLLGGVIHELNSPLATVVANAEWVRAELDAPSPDLEQMREVMADSEQVITRMTKLVAQLRRLSHPGSEKGKCELGHAVESVSLLCRPQVQTVGELIIDVEEISAPLAISEEELVSVLSNLIINATHAASGKRAKIELRARSAGPNRVELQVKDNGSGIAKEHLERIFCPSFTTKPVGKGSGLGLSLVRRIVDGSGGSITVDSTVGVGTTFTLAMPLASC